jgi:hypothetical protein
MSEPSTQHWIKPSAEISFSEIIRDQLVLLALANEAISPKMLREHGARDVLLLDKDIPNQTTRQDDHVARQYRRIPDVRKNNCTVALLHGSAAYALLEKREFARFHYVLVPCSIFPLAKILGLALYGRRKLLLPIGKTTLTLHDKKRTYHVLEVHYKTRDQARQYAPSGLTPLSILQLLDGVDYISLRGHEAIEKGTHKGDIDLLVSQQGLRDLKQRFSQKVGTYSVDAYTDDGQGGHAFKSVPYFTPELARTLLANNTVTNAGIRIATPHWRFVSYCYHLLFHDKCVITADNQGTLQSTSFSKPHYWEEMQRLAREAGQKAPETIEQIEDLLRQNNAMPSLDLIGFYSNRYPFLKKRYFEKKIVPPGLATFFVRDFGEGSKIVPALRQRLQSQFEIIREGSVDEMRDAAMIRGVRGGNWMDADAPNGIAKPVHWFVCIDHTPAPLSARSKRKHPRLDNENIRIKDELRRELGMGDKKGLRVIHSSDNSLEALDHIHHLSLTDDPDFANKIQPWLSC